MDIFWTIFAGVLVYVIGQWVVRFVIDPIVAFKIELGEVQHALLECKRDILNMKNQRDLSERLNLLAARMIVAKRAIPGYRYLAKIKLLPCSNQVFKGYQYLNNLSDDLSAGRGNVGDGNQYLNELESIFDVPEIVYLKLDLEPSK
ncbi:hypothetical protein [Chromohalobacter sp.]|uniref:hypothetical protein n=1 Tax=Chromohalobacter sp. TaxID=50740 RepID=UPI003242E7E9